MNKSKFYGYNNFKNEIDSTLKVIELNKKTTEIPKLIDEYKEYTSDLEKENLINYNTYFYSKILSICETMNNLELALKISNKVIKTLLDEIKLNKYEYNPYYKILIDFYVISALHCYSFKDIERSRKYFDKSVKFGEEYINESRDRFHDEISCAYTWVGFFLFNEKKYEESLKCFERVLELYNEVKDDPHYSVREKDSVPNSINYIKQINMILNR